MRTHLLLLQLSLVLLNSACATPWFSPSFLRANNPDTTIDSNDDEVERRWQSLLTYCGGNWSGSIGWYDAVYNNDTKIGTLVPRNDNHKRNMRLSFHTDPKDNTRANWIVYHARGQHVREQVVLEKYPVDNVPVQLFYCFDDGNLGRTGRDFSKLPVIEHGFWKDGMRHTIVLVYNTNTRRLEKICFVQQARHEEGEQFDVASSNPRHIRILPKRPTVTLKQLQSRCTKLKLFKAECILANGTRSIATMTSSREILDRLLQTDKESESSSDANDMFHLILPNNVVLACPWHLESKGVFNILMALPTVRVQEIQVVDFLFEDASIRSVTASYWK